MGYQTVALTMIQAEKFSLISTCIELKLGLYHYKLMCTSNCSPLLDPWQSWLNPQQILADIYSLFFHLYLSNTCLRKIKRRPPIKDFQWRFILNRNADYANLCPVVHQWALHGPIIGPQNSLILGDLFW